MNYAVQWYCQQLTTHKTVNKEDQGEDNKDPDWLIKQSIARQVAGGVHCTTQEKPIQSLQQYCWEK